MQTYWNPWSMFDELDRSLFAAGPARWPELDIEDSEEETIITADLPGMTEEDVEITVQGAHLVVRGERRLKDGAYVRRGRQYGRFERQFWIGDTYDTDRMSAHLENGVLTIHLVKATAAKPRRIKLSTGGLASKVKGLLGGEKDKKAA